MLFLDIAYLIDLAIKNNCPGLACCDKAGSWAKVADELKDTGFALGEKCQ